MTDEIQKTTRRLKAQEPRDYEVGYARPPNETKFQKGQSGNPKGRPKGAKSKLPRLDEERLKSIIIREAYRPIKMRDGTKEVTLALAEAVFRSICVNAAKGKTRAQRLFTQMLERTETANKRHADEWLKAAIEYRIECMNRIDCCKRLGLPIPEMLPHPDHVVIDMVHNTATIIGPMTPEDKVRWDRLQDCKNLCIGNIRQLSEELARARSPRRRAEIEDKLEVNQSILRRLEDVPYPY